MRSLLRLFVLRNSAGLLIPAVLVSMAIPAAVSASSGERKEAGESLIAGRSTTVTGERKGDLVLIGADTNVEGQVQGDLIAWGGRVRLGPDAEITGSVLLVGSSYEPASGAKVRGRTLVWADLGELARLAVTQEQALPGETIRRWMWGLRFASLAAWLLGALILAVTARESLERAAESIRIAPLKMFLSGLAVFLGFLLLAWFFLEISSTGMGFPFLVFLGAIAVSAKLFGMSAVFLAAGRRLLRRPDRGIPAPGPTAVAAGLALLGAIRLVPVIGTPAWVAASLVGLGSVAALLARRRPATAIV